VGWLVEAGVRRCVAAHRAGKAYIFAEVVVAGVLLQTLRLPLVELYSTKSTILRDRRYLVNTE